MLGLNLIEDAPTYSYYTINETKYLEILATQSRLAYRQRQSAPAIGFLVDDLDHTEQELTAAGVQLKSGIEEWHSDNERHRWIYLEDPEGHTSLLLERHQTGE